VRMVAPRLQQSEKRHRGGDLWSHACVGRRLAHQARQGQAGQTVSESTMRIRHEAKLLRATTIERVPMRFDGRGVKDALLSMSSSMVD
jgi:hypothetical protein